MFCGPFRRGQRHSTLNRRADLPARKGLRHSRPVVGTRIQFTVSSSPYSVHRIQFTGFGWAVRSGAIISDLLGLVIFSAWNHCFAYAGQITLMSVAAIRRYLIIVRGYPQRSTSGRFISAAKSLDGLAPDEQISDSVTCRELHSPSHEQDRHI